MAGGDLKSDSEDVREYGVETERRNGSGSGRQVEETTGALPCLAGESVA